MPHIGKDLYSWLKLGAPVVAHAQHTAAKADNPVIDLRDEEPNTIVAFIVLPTAVATGDGSNYIEIELWEADDKTSSTALDASASQVGLDDFVPGMTEDGVRLDPTDLPTLKIDDTGMAGKVYFFQYRGYKPCIQIRLAETGTADATLAVLPIYYNGDTKNIKAPVVN